MQNNDRKKVYKTIQLSQKQQETLAYLRDSTTTEVLCSGSSGSAKSYACCYYVLTMSMMHPGFRTALIRTNINLAHTTTMETFKAVVKMCGYTEDIYKFDSTTNTYNFQNGSIIYLISGELTNNDRISNLSRAGGVEISCLYIEEANGVDKLVFDIYKTRLRHVPDSLKDKDFMFKTICCTNPDVNSWLYEYFWLKHENNTLPDNIKVVHSTVEDNPFVPIAYKNNLKAMTGIQRARLYEGRWVGQNDNALINQTKLDLIYSPTSTTDLTATHISFDVARFGQDSTVIIVWSDSKIIEIISHKNKSTTETARIITDLANSYGIPSFRIAGDEDGVGGGIIDMVRCIGIHNGSAAKNKENYYNLKTQLYYYLADDIDNFGILCELDESTLTRIKQELGAVNAFSDGVGKLKISDKKEIKSKLGFSPDFSDAIAYGYYFNAASKLSRFEIF